MQNAEGMPPPTSTTADQNFALYRDTRDPAALARVFDATAPKLALIAMHLARDATQADDLVQATFLAAMRRAERYDPARPVLAWLTGILQKQAAMRRREGRRQVDPTRAALGSSRSPADTAALREASDEVIAAVDGMPAMYRQVLLLRLVHDLRSHEIARALDMSPQTVRSRLHRGLELLRRALPKGLAVPALMVGATEALAGRGLAAMRAALLQEANKFAPVSLTAGSTIVAPTVVFSLGICMKKVLLSATVVALLLFAATSWFWSRDGVGQSASGAASLSVAIPPPTARSNESVPPSPDRTALAPPQGAARSEDLMRVTVVDAETGLPQAGAEVLSTACDRAALTEAEMDAFVALFLSGDVEARARRFGVAWRTGPDGSVTVPRPTGSNEIHVARAGDRFGSEWPGPHTADLRILLRADRTLRVQVIDHAGQAAIGVALRLMMTWPDAGEPSLVDLGVTDDVGMLVAPHVQERVLAEQRRRSGPPTSLAVSPQLQGIEATGMSIDLDRLPPESLRLQLPPTGSVALEVIDKRESQSGAFLTTSLLATIATAREVLSAQARTAIGFEEQPAQQGMRVVFPFVGLGGRLSAYWVAPGRQTDTIEVVGPRSAGEEVVVRVSLPAPGPMLRARVLDEAGRPLRRRHVSAHLAIGDERTARKDTTTDGDGELWLPIDARFVGQPVQSVQLEGLRAAYWGASGRMVRVEPRGITVGGITQLGDLTLHEAPRIASGRVVDDIGRPVDEVTLDVYPVMVPGESKRPMALPVSVRLRPNGAFEIRGFVCDEEMEIRRGGEGWYEAEAPVRFRPGVENLLIERRRPCGVIVEVVHDLPVEQVGVLRLHAVDVASHAEHTTSVSMPIDAQRARLVLGPLLIGRYSIQVRLPHDLVPLAVVDGVEVTRGIANDPRLREVDLRGKVRVVHVHVVDGDGQPVRGEGQLQVHSANNSALASVDLRDGVFRVPLGTSAVHATICVKGCRDHEVCDLDADRTVRLQPAFAVRVRLASQVALPQGVTLHAFARRKGQGVPPNLKSKRERYGPIHGSGDPGELQPEPGVFLFRIARADDYEFTFVLGGKPDARSVAVPTTPGQARVEPTTTELVFTAAPMQVQEALNRVLR